ncbi:MAG: ATP-dependent metallopeptidase FtsH/Yme1/Tma family protein, partial [Deltaproteobacteria bacterium]|nr:ATP-dependent metallopeptidase FtsH/Yme1/Tma family protein [Deltaproteobacteria bacterium]
MNTFYKNLSLWLVIGLVMILLFQFLNRPGEDSSEATYSDFLDKVEKGEVSRVTVQGERIHGQYVN